MTVSTEVRGVTADNHPVDKLLLAIEMLVTGAGEMLFRGLRATAIQTTYGKLSPKERRDTSREVMSAGSCS